METALEAALNCIGMIAVFAALYRYNGFCLQMQNIGRFAHISSNLE